MFDSISVVKWLMSIYTYVILCVCTLGRKSLLHLKKCKVLHSFFIKHLNARKIVTESAESEKCFLRQLFINQNMNWQKESFITLSKKIVFNSFFFVFAKLGCLFAHFLVQMWFRDRCGMNVTRKSWMNTVSWIDL